MRRTSLWLFLFVCMVGFPVSRSIGLAWDEADNIYASGQYINFFRHGFDRQILESRAPDASYFHEKIYSLEPDISRYPPVPYYLGSVFALIGERFGFSSRQDITMFFHWATIVFFAFLVVYVYRFGLILGLRNVYATVAALFVFLYPALFGHGLSNLKDTAQVSLFTISLYYLVREQKKTDMLVGALVWGLALATKINAVYVPIIWGLWQLIRKKRLHIDFVRNGVVLCVVGLGVVVLVWPYLWYDTIAHAGKVLQYFSTVGQGYHVIWNGSLHSVGTGTSLWWYPWAAFSITTPVLMLISIVIGFGFVCFSARRTSIYRLLLLWIFIPMIRAIFPHAAFYDELRHFMEVLPALLIVAAFGVQYVGNLKKYGHRIAGLLVGVLIAQMCWIHVRYTPFSTGYYNILADAPNERYDRDIEALSVPFAMQYLHEKYGSLRVWFHIGGHLSWHYMETGDRYVYPDQADSIVVLNKASHPLNPALVTLLDESFLLVKTISRADMVLARIYRRR